jgi:hypothetical protein
VDILGIYDDIAKLHYNFFLVEGFWPGHKTSDEVRCGVVLAVVQHLTIDIGQIGSMLLHVLLKKMGDRLTGAETVCIQADNCGGKFV